MTLTVLPQAKLLCIPKELMWTSVPSSSCRMALSPDHGNPAAKFHQFAEGCGVMPVWLETNSFIAARG